MLLAGDEIGNSQQGNNNAYCQDNEIGWIDWASADKSLLGFVRKLSQFRKDHPVLRQNRFLHGDTRPSDGLADVAWTDFAGHALQWKDPGLRCLCLTIRHAADTPSYDNNGETVFIVFNRDDKAAEVVLPRHAIDIQLTTCVWRRHIDTARPEAGLSVEARSTINVGGQSVVALVADIQNRPK